MCYREIVRIWIAELKVSFLLKAFIAVTFALLALPNNALATTWYVSSIATPTLGTVPDGKTWGTAWRDFSGATVSSRIDWTHIQPGDTIEVDAGPAPFSTVVYHTPLVVQKSGIVTSTVKQPIIIEVPNDPNHNGGFAEIEPGANNVGIDLITYRVSNVIIQGSQWNPIGWPPLAAPNFGVLGANTGVFIEYYNRNITLQNLQLQQCIAGMNILGGYMEGYYLLINNNSVAIYSNPEVVGPDQGAYIAYSWIFAQNQTTPSNGLSTRANVGDFIMSIGYSVFGPGLSNAIETYSNTDSIDISHNLFLNATLNQLYVHQPPQKLNFYDNILYQNNKVSSCLNLTESPNVSIYDNIFYGGGVNVTGPSVLGQGSGQGGNIQYLTGGSNPQALGSSQATSPFAPDVGTVPNNGPWISLYFTPANTPANNALNLQETIQSLTSFLEMVPQSE